MKNFQINPFPVSELKAKDNLWIYGRAERESWRLQQLIKAKNEAQLKVGYPGEFMQPHNRMHFRAHFPAGSFPVSFRSWPAGSCSP